MTAHTTHRGWAGLMLITLLIAPVMPVSAQTATKPSLAERLPADALLYVGWPGFDALAKSSEETEMARLLEEPEVQHLRKALRARGELGGGIAVFPRRIDQVDRRTRRVHVVDRVAIRKARRDKHAYEIVAAADQAVHVHEVDGEPPAHDVQAILARGVARPFARCAVLADRILEEPAVGRDSQEIMAKAKDSRRPGIRAFIFPGMHPCLPMRPQRLP